MNKFWKFILTLLALTIVTVVLTYPSELLGFIKGKEKIYILFDYEKDKFPKFDWSEHKQHFPDSFDLEKGYEDLEGWRLLTQGHKQKFFKIDSLRKSTYRYPIKYVKIKNGRSQFSISTSEYSGIEFRTKKPKKIDLKTLSKLNVLSMDSIMNMEPDKRWMNSWDFENVTFYVVELHKDKAFIMETEFYHYEI